MFVYYDADVQEDLLLCKTLTIGEEIFNLLNSFIKQTEISWKKCLDVYTD